MKLTEIGARSKATITAAEAAVQRANATIRLVSGGSDMGSRTRPGNQPPGPRELRFLLEMTLVYSNALKDTIAAFEEAAREYPALAPRYARLIDFLRSLVSPGEGGLQTVLRECRVLLGLEEEEEK